MSKIVYVKGLSTNLDSNSLKDGQILFTEDTNELYIDFLDSATGELLRKPITDKELAAQLQQFIDGLDKVENKSSEEIRNEITYENVINALGYVPSIGESVTLNAEGIVYDNIESGLISTNVQSALDEVVEKNAVNQVNIEQITLTLNNKIDKIEGKTLSTNDFTDTLKQKLENGSSINLMSGEEIYLTNSIDSKVATFALYGKTKQDTTNGKNLLPYPYTEGTITTNGINFTDNGDGTITANGTATGLVVYNLCISTTLKTGRYILSKGNDDATITLVIARSKDSRLSIIHNTKDNIAEFALTENDINNYDDIRIQFRCTKNTTFDNLVFKPMLRFAEITDETWEQPTNGPSPSPSYPQEIEVAGNSGNIKINFSNEDNSKITTAIIPTPNGLAGIKVTKNGNYTDLNGQQWICDKIIKYTNGSGEYIQRIAKILIDGINNVCTWVGSYVNQEEETVIQMNIPIIGGLIVNTNSILSNKFQSIIWNGINTIKPYTCRIGSDEIICCTLKESDGVTDVATANTWLQENPVIIYYILKEPITTPLTIEQLAEIEKLHTFYTITNISNDADCGMSLTYSKDSLDGKFISDMYDNIKPLISNSGQINKIWQTDENGVPTWREAAPTAKVEGNKLIL